ncbi:hypothetical protein QBC46DRAFT_314568 [Diplogelasinospora grovesii]|uniref:Uncharacterized protein n=1 Tax=Diplogelasinospora grovesii TaxID=303347 RepID=A0AAN6N7E9_9PEZI|nr:hypothetical protein QBC46DRAFT_314568 [Diplogelasinospora grovesii]
MLHVRHFRPSATEFNQPGCLLHEAHHYCNRTAPIYLLERPWEQRRRLVELFLHVLENYLYHKWFRPYRSEIEYGQFLAAVIYPKPIESLPARERCSRPVVDLIRAMHSHTCTKVLAAQDRVRTGGTGALAELMSWSSADPGDQARLTHLTSREPEQHVRDLDFFILQPVFRAVAVAARTRDYEGENRSELGRVPVLVVRTGVEEGLSAPIDLDAIPEDKRKGVVTEDGGPDGKILLSAVETDLDTAVAFLMGLEQREIAAFGLRPDPVESTRNLESGFTELTREDVLLIADRLGWDAEAWPPPEGPSSTWVDTEIYTTWSGLGAEADDVYDATTATPKRECAEEEYEARYLARQLPGRDLTFWDDDDDSKLVDELL